MYEFWQRTYATVFRRDEIKKKCARITVSFFLMCQVSVQSFGFVFVTIKHSCPRGARAASQLSFLFCVCFSFFLSIKLLEIFSIVPLNFIHHLSFLSCSQKWGRLRFQEYKILPHIRERERERVRLIANSTTQRWKTRLKHKKKG